MAVVTPRADEVNYLLLQLIAVVFGALTIVCPMFVGKGTVESRGTYYKKAECLRLTGYQSVCSLSAMVSGSYDEEDYYKLFTYPTTGSSYGYYYVEISDSFGYGCPFRNSLMFAAMVLFFLAFAVSVLLLLGSLFNLCCTPCTCCPCCSFGCCGGVFSLLVTLTMIAVLGIEVGGYAAPMCDDFDDDVVGERYALSEIFGLGYGFAFLCAACGFQLFATIYAFLMCAHRDTQGEVEDEVAGGEGSSARNPLKGDSSGESVDVEVLGEQPAGKQLEPAAAEPRAPTRSGPAVPASAAGRQ